MLWPQILTFLCLGSYKLLLSSLGPVKVLWLSTDIHIGNNSIQLLQGPTLVRYDPSVNFLFYFQWKSFFSSPFRSMECVVIYERSIYLEATQSLNHVLCLRTLMFRRQCRDGQQ